jgi:spoIIIJ-associated protein
VEDHAQPAPARPVSACLPAVESLLRDLIRRGGFELNFTIREAGAAPDDIESPEYVVEFSGPDSDLLIERHAELLNALEHVVLKAARLGEGQLGKIAFDCREWRRLRAEELKLMAQVAADRAVETGEPFALNPMNARERRIVHLALRDRAEVRTASEGAAGERHVVIYPAGVTKPFSPPLPRRRRR